MRELLEYIAVMSLICLTLWAISYIVVQKTGGIQEEPIEVEHRHTIVELKHRARLRTVIFCGDSLMVIPEQHLKIPAYLDKFKPEQ